MVVKYDSSHGLFFTTLQYSHTIVPDVLRRCDFWLLLVVHGLLAGAFRTGWLLQRFPKFETEDSPYHISWNDIKVITGMTTFFEVFYTNQCFQRYLTLYNISNQMMSCCCEIVVLFRLHLGKDAKNYMRLGVRFALASTFLTFHEVHDSEVSQEEFQTLVEQGLLKPLEKEILQRYANQQHAQLLLYWAADVGKEGLAAAKAPNNAMKLILTPLLALRANEQELLKVVALPIPFQYYHLLNAMVLINLFLWGYAMAICDSMFASLIYVMASIIFMGMLELADELVMPFGDDEVDFPVKDWLDNLLDLMEVLLNGNYESLKAAQSEVLGNSWQEVVKAEEGTKFKKTTDCIQWPWLKSKSRESMSMDGDRIWNNSARLYRPLTMQADQASP
jgi:predicted membrane chloride channel (bestrophin family)